MKLLNYLNKGTSRTVAIKKNIIGSLFIKGFSIIISLLLVPLTLGYVSSDVYGIWLTLSSIIVWLNFFDVGFTLGLKNKLAEAIALEDFSKGKVLVSTTYFVMVIIFIPLCCILELIIPYINWSIFLNVSDAYNSDIIRAIQILIFCFSIQMVANVLTAVASAYQKVAISSAFPVIGNFFSVLIILLLTKYCPPSLHILALALSITPILVIIVASLVLYNNKFKAVSPNWHCIDRKYIKGLFGLGSKFFLIQIQIIVLYQCTNVLISNISGPNEVTAYNIAYKYIGIAMMILNIIITPLWPAFTDAYTRKDYLWMKNVYKKMCKIWIYSVAIVAIMVLISPIVYHLWIGDKATISYWMTILIGIYTIIHSWDVIQVNMINGIGTVKLQTYITLIGIVGHIPLSLLFGQYIGCYGVVVSMILVNIIYSLIFTIQIRRILNKKAFGIWIS